MVICGNCQSKQLDGVIFCLECGANILGTEGYETTRQLPYGAQATSAPGGAARGSFIALVVLPHRRRIELDATEELLIGRKDQTRGIVPDVDLGPEGGYEAGVSRRHAILAYTNGGYTVEDLGSANGTFVNGRRLSAQVAVSLSDGDELACGTLRMRVELVGVGGSC
jgi:pSer/pThr/pTyr-binding forkhead associated (FHA) protein